MQKFKSAKASSQYNAASLWKRGLSYLIDLLIINLIVTLTFGDNIKNLDSSFNLLLNPGNNLFLVSIFIILASLFYFAILEYKLGQTLGEMLMRINVVSLIGKELKFSQALLRNITVPFPIVLLVDTAYMLFKGGNQRLFEVFSATAVVQKELVFK